MNIMDGFPWNEIISRFPHIAEEIFEGLDDQSLTSCRLVEKSWKNVIDGKNYPWKRIVKRRNLEQKWEYGNTYLHLASKYGHPEMFEKIFKEEIRKNPGNTSSGMTPFHFACEKGHSRIAEFILKSSIENIFLFIDLNAKDFSGKTGYHYACESGHVKIVELLINKIKGNYKIEGTPILNLAMVKRVSVKISVKKIRQKKSSKNSRKLKKAILRKKGKSQTNKQNSVLRSFACPHAIGKLKK